MWDSTVTSWTLKEQVELHKTKWDPTEARGALQQHMGLNRDNWGSTEANGTWGSTGTAGAQQRRVKFHRDKEEASPDPEADEKSQSQVGLH